MFISPKEILEKCGLSSGAIVVDLGAGSGHYTLTAAEMVSRDGAQGKVYAIDVQKDLLDRLKNEATHQPSHSAQTIEVIWGNIEKAGGTKLPDATADLVILSNVLFQTEDRDGCLKEATRILKPTGRLLFVDWSDTSSLSLVGHHLISPSQAKSLFAKAGLTVESDMAMGEHHYGFILRKK